LISPEARLHAEGASRSTLAGKTVTDRDRERIARDFQPKLATVTGRNSGGHHRET
jgi:hypothetical protein